MLSRPVISYSLQRAAPLNIASPNGSHSTRGVTMTLHSYEAALETAASGNLQSLEQHAPGEGVAARLSREVVKGDATTRVDQQRSVAAMVEQKSAYLFRERYSRLFQQQLARHQQLQRQCRQEGKPHKQHAAQQLRGQRLSRVIANPGFGAGQSEDLRHSSSRVHLPGASQEALGERRHLQQETQERNRFSSPYNPKVHLHRISLGPSTATQNVLVHLNTHTNIDVAEFPRSSVASSIERNRSGKISAKVSASCAVEHRNSVPGPAQILGASPPAKTPFKPSAAAAAGAPAVHSPSSERAHHLPSKAPPHPVKPATSPGNSRDQAGTLSFAATAIGCSGLLCVAGFALLLAIFRSYRLRQQKHEAAKQLMRRIHWSGEQHTRELVVQYSRELRNQKNQQKKEWREGPAQPCWKSSSSIYVGSHPRTAIQVVPHSGQQHGKTAPNDVADYRAAIQKAEPTQTQLERAEAEVPHGKASNSGQDCRHWYSSREAAAAALNVVARWVKASQVLRTGGVSGVERFCDYTEGELSLKKQVPEPYIIGDVVRAPKGDCSSGMPFNQNTSSLATLTQAEVAAGCCACGKGSLKQVDVQACRQTATSFVGAGASMLPRASSRASPENLSTMSSLPLQARKHKKQKRPLQRQQSRPEEHKHPRCPLKQKPPQVSQKVTPTYNHLPCTSLGQRFLAPPDRPTSLVQLAVSQSLPLTQPFGTATKEEQTEQAGGSQQVSPLSFDMRNPGQRISPRNMEMCACSSRLPPHVAVSAHHEKDRRSRVSGVSYTASRLADFLHLLPRFRTGSTNTGNCRRSEMSARSPMTSINHAEQSRRHNLLRCGRLWSGKVVDFRSRSVPDEATGQRRSDNEQLASCVGEERAVSNPVDSGNIVTWVSEVSDNSAGPLDIRNSHTDRGCGPNASATAQNTGEEEDVFFSRTVAPEWDDSGNSDIPTHMMTTAINKEESGSSETAESPDGDITGNGDDAIVEFDSSNISVAVEEVVHSQITVSESIR